MCDRYLRNCSAGMLNNVGAELYNKGQKEAALTIFQKALCQKIEAVGQASAECDGGEKLAKRGQRTQQLVQLKECLRLSLQPTSKWDQSPNPFNVPCDVGMELVSDEACFCSSHILVSANKLCVESVADDSAILHNVGLVEIHRNKLDSAIYCFGTASTFTRNQDGQCRFLIYACYHNIGRLLYFQKRYAEALDAFYRILDGTTTRIAFDEKNMNMDHRNVGRLAARSVLCISITSARLNQLDNALKYGSQALQLIRENSASHNCFDVAIVTHVLGYIFLITGSHEQARSLFSSFLVQAKSMGWDRYHPYVFNALHCEGVALSRAGRFDEAMTFLLSSLEAKQSVLGNYHLNVAQTLFKIGQILHEQEKYTDAISVYEKALYVQSKMLQGHNIEVLRTLCHMAHVYHFQMKLDKALSLHQQSLIMCKTIFGENHPLVAFILSLLYHISVEMGDDKRALGYLCECQETRNICGVKIPTEYTLVVAIRMGMCWGCSLSAPAA